MPLQQIQKDWLKNPSYSEDFTILNRLIPPEKAYPASEWEKLSPSLKLRAQPSYYFLEYFVYEPSLDFPAYEITYHGITHTIGHYMIDFRNIQKVSCSAFFRGHKKTPAKVLELSVSARVQLREKIVNYYSRVPGEGQVLESEMV